tara:strand:- start:481 stop:2754 length:2274 start_codon:yes stop_codon:yes gene_type:complete
MASKQTLKSLLGGSDSREQVSLDLGTPALRPAVQRAGQYSVAVQATPKTNSALQLAQALRQAPQVLGQVNNIAKTMGAEAASQVSGADLADAMQDEEAKGILGYNKAYQYAISKRHFAVNKDKMREQFLSLAGNQSLPTGNSEQERLASVNEFTTRLTEERQRFDQDLMDKFGGDAHREEALRALSGALVDDMQNEAAALYTKNLEEQTEMFISADAAAQIKEKGVAVGLDYAIKEYKALGISPKGRSTKLRGIITSEALLLIEQEKFAQAEALVNEASSYSLYGNAQLFGSIEGKKELATLKSQIAKPQETLSKQITNSAKALGQQTSLFANIITHGTVEDQQAAFDNVFSQIGITREQLDELGISLNTSSATESFRSLSLASQALLKSDQISDVQRGALMGIQSKIGTIDESKRFAKAPIGIAAEEDYSGFESTITKAINGNINADLGELVFRTDDGRVVPHTDPRIQTALQKAEKSRAFLDKEKHPNSFFFSDEASDLEERVSKAVTGAKSKKYIQDSEYNNEFIILKEQMAKEVWQVSSQLPTEAEQIEHFNTNFPTKLRTLTEELTTEIKERKKLSSTSADKIQTLNQRTGVLDNAEEISDDGKYFGYKYNSLVNEFYDENMVNDPQLALETAMKDRALIREEHSTISQPLLAASYIRYGINSLSDFTPETVSELRSLQLGLADVYVGDEIRGELNKAIIYYQKKSEGETASVAEENAMVKMRTVTGAYGAEDLQMLQTAITLFDTQLKSFE